MKVLIVGGSGLLGTTLAEVLKAAKFELVLPSSSNTKSEFICDFTVFSQVQAIFQKVNPSIVVNLSGLTNVDQCEQDLLSAYLLNAQIVQNISRVIQMQKPSIRFLHVSTDHVYDAANVSQSSTEAEVRPLNVYALTKLIGETYAANALVLRTNFTGRSKTLGRVSFTDWIVNELRAGNELNLFDDVYFSPLTMQMVSRQIMRGILSDKTGVYNLGSVGGISKFDFGVSFAEKLGLPVQKIKPRALSLAGLKAKRPKNMVMDSTKFASDFATPLSTVDEVIEDLVKEYSYEHK